MMELFDFGLSDEVFPFAWALGLALLHVVMYSGMRATGSFKENQWLSTHQLSALSSLLVCVYIGVTSWPTVAASAEAQTAEGRLFHSFEGGVWVAKVNCGLQFLDLIMAIVVPGVEMRAVMIGHHSVATLLAFFVVHFKYCTYYAIFFTGLSEISSIVLIFIDMFEYCPSYAKSMPTLHFITKLSFAVSFFIFRVFWWGAETVTFVQDTMWSLDTNAAAAHGVPDWLVWFYVAANVALTTLQLYFASVIVGQALEIFGCVKPAKKEVKIYENKQS